MDQFLRLPSDDIRDILQQANASIVTTTDGPAPLTFTDGAEYRVMADGSVRLRQSHNLKGNPKGKAARKRWRAERRAALRRRKSLIGF